VASGSKSTRPILIWLILCLVLGISLSTETMSRFGLADNYVYVVSLGLLITTLMLGKRTLLVLLVLVGVLAINLPEVFLQGQNIDRDFLLAVVCSLILAPTVYNLLRDQ